MSKKKLTIDGIDVENRQVKMMNLLDIKPYDNNPRENTRSIMLLEDAIQQYGFLIPVTVDRDRVIVTGHSRYFAARNIGLTEIPVIVLDDLSAVGVMEYRIADNKVQEFSVLDFAAKGEKITEYMQNDQLFAFAFPQFAVGDFGFDAGAGREPQEEEQGAECMCPECLEEFTVMPEDWLPDETEDKAEI
jgi:hypothetical protein